MKCFATLFFFCFALQTTVFATSFFVSTEDEKIRKAEAICAVKVLTVKPYQLTQTELIQTEAQLEPLECFKGTREKSFSVIWPGGEVQAVDKDGKPVVRGTHVPGTPQLTQGQKVILYLSQPDPKTPATVLGWSTGVIPLTADLKIDPKFSRRVGQTLEDFRKKVQRALSAQNH